MDAAESSLLVDVRERQLRAKLLDLQYHEPLHSCELVERLLGDVLHSVENFESLAKRYDQQVRSAQEQTIGYNALCNEVKALLSRNRALGENVTSLEKNLADLQEKNAKLQQLQQRQRQAPPVAGDGAAAAGASSGDGGGVPPSAATAVLVAELKEHARLLRARDAEIGRLKTQLEKHAAAANQDALVRNLTAETLRLKQQVLCLEAEMAPTRNDSASSTADDDAPFGTALSQGGGGAAPPGGPPATESTAATAAADPPAASAEAHAASKAASQIASLENQLSIERDRCRMLMRERRKYVAEIRRKDAEIDALHQRVRSAACAPSAAGPCESAAEDMGENADDRPLPEPVRTALLTPRDAGGEPPQVQGNSLKQDLHRAVELRSEALRQLQEAEARAEEVEATLRRRLIHACENAREARQRHEAAQLEIKELKQEVRRASERGATQESRVEVFARRLTAATTAAREEHARLAAEAAAARCEANEERERACAAEAAGARLRARLESVEATCRALIENLLVARQAAAEARECPLSAPGPPPGAANFSPGGPGSPTRIPGAQAPGGGTGSTRDWQSAAASDTLAATAATACAPRADRETAAPRITDGGAEEARRPLAPDPRGGVAENATRAADADLACADVAWSPPDQVRMHYTPRVPWTDGDLALRYRYHRSPARGEISERGQKRIVRTKTAGAAGEKDMSAKPAANLAAPSDEISQPITVTDLSATMPLTVAEGARKKQDSISGDEKDATGGGASDSTSVLRRPHTVMLTGRFARRTLLDVKSIRTRML